MPTLRILNFSLTNRSGRKGSIATAIEELKSYDPFHPGHLPGAAWARPAQSWARLTIDLGLSVPFSCASSFWTHGRSVAVGV